jgi:hypothetical protein
MQVMPGTLFDASTAKAEIRIKSKRYDLWVQRRTDLKSVLSAKKSLAESQNLKCHHFQLGLLQDHPTFMLIS